MKHNKVERFIAHFQNPGTIDTFTNGCCYWFTQILTSRFWLSSIYYNPVDGHFATKIRGVLYDITGRLEDDGHWVRWARYKAVEPADAFRVMKYCIYKED